MHGYMGVRICMRVVYPYCFVCVCVRVCVCVCVRVCAQLCWTSRGRAPIKQTSRWRKKNVWSQMPGSADVRDSVPEWLR